MFVDRRETKSHRPEGCPEEPEESETDLSAEGNNIVFGECAAVDCVDTMLKGSLPPQEIK